MICVGLFVDKYMSFFNLLQVDSLVLGTPRTASIVAKDLTRFADILAR